MILAGIIIHADGTVQQIGDIQTWMPIINSMREILPELERQELQHMVTVLTDEQKEAIKHMLYNVEE